MSYFELILQRPIENAPAIFLIIMGFIEVARRVLNLFSTQQNHSKELQAGNQAIITQDNSLQSKLLDEMTARRVSDEQIKSRLMDLLEEKVTRIDGTTLRIDGTTLATSAEVKALVLKVDKFDKAMGNFYQAMKKKGMV